MTQISTVPTISTALPVEAGHVPHMAPLSVRIMYGFFIAVPLLGLVASIILLWGPGIDWIHLALLGVGYILTGLGITIGYHRLFTHKAFATPRWMMLFWGVLGSMAAEGPLLTWVGVHRKHHQHSDDELDPHSPNFGRSAGLLGVLRGWLHAHVGWIVMARPNSGASARYTADLRRDPLIRFVDRYWWLWIALGLLLPGLIAWAVTGTVWGGVLGVLWGGLVRILVVHHITWSVNSACHLWGFQSYRSHDESRNNPVFGVLALGEGWHNNHHAFPTSARHGLAWWQFDLSWLVIRAMQAVGLAHQVRLPTAERMAALSTADEPTAPRTSP